MGLFKWIGQFFQKSPGEAKAPPVDVPARFPEPEVEPEFLRREERRRRERLNARPGTRVLIIDDSPTVIAVFRKILRSAGFDVLEALSAEQGVEIARRERPELIFLDIVLPGMNGFAALRLMRKDAQMQDIPVIMISGNEQATEQFYAERIGADDFMKKPFSRHEVFARIELLLDADLRPKSKRALRSLDLPGASQQAA